MRQEPGLVKKGRQKHRLVSKEGKVRQEPSLVKKKRQKHRVVSKRRQANEEGKAG